MKLSVLLVFVAVSGAFALDGPKCEAPNGEGLQPVLAEFFKMVPTEKILDLISDRLSYCKQTQSVFEYFKSNDFRQIGEMAQNQPAFKSLVQYFCKDLYFDVEYYMSQLSILLELPKTRNHVPGHGMGFKKLLQDIMAVIPVDDMMALLEEKLATNSYLQLAFQKINSDEFDEIIEAFQANAAYTDMKDRFRGIHVDVEYIIDTLRHIFRSKAS